MEDFCAKGADGVTVRLVTDFVVVLRMAGGLPSLALVATGEELRRVFIVAVVKAPAGLPSCEGAAGSLASMGAAAALRRGSLCRVPPGLARAQNSARRVLGGHLEPRAGCWGLPKASGNCLPANGPPAPANWRLSSFCEPSGFARPMRL